MIPIDEEIPRLLLSESDGEEVIAPKAREWHELLDDYLADPDMEAFDQLLLTSDLANSNESPVLVRIAPAEFQIAQKTDPFCNGIRKRLSRK